MATTSMRRADNLPAELSRIVGRRAESAAVRRLLSDSRLVTLTGVGGVGKTRLAVHVARQVRSAFPDGVCLVMLADLATPGLLPTAVMSAASRGLRAGAGIAELADELAERQLLLVLDNCEHLAAACADLVTTLLRRCPGLRVLTTSRERLRVEGEAVFAVPPLSVPAEGQHLELSDLTRYEALALFVERASAVHRTSPRVTWTRSRSRRCAAVSMDCRSPSNSWRGVRRRCRSRRSLNVPTTVFGC
jgi:predicted ATPase